MSGVFAVFLLPALICLLIGLISFFAAIGSLEKCIRGRGEKLIAAGFKIFPLFVFGFIFSVLGFVIPSVGAVVVAITVLLMMAGVVFLPFGLLWFGLGIARMQRRVEELESLDGGLNSALRERQLQPE